MLSKDGFRGSRAPCRELRFPPGICAIPTNSLNKTFATFTKALKKDRYLESIQAIFLSLPSYRRFPDDDEFVREISGRDLYNFRSRSLLASATGEPRPQGARAGRRYTIEHILPQNPDLS